MAVNLIDLVANKTWLDTKVITNIISLLDEWNTIPFIARYRKELTQWASDEQLREFHEVYTYTKNLETRKEDVIRLINEKWLLTDELKQQILDAETLARVEDLYRPFKEKKNTKATIAKAKWLDPLAEILKKAELSQEEFETKAEEFVKDTWDAKTTVKNKEEAIQWAKDIIAEDVSDHANLREDIKKYEEIKSEISTKTTKTFEENGVYKIYWDYKKNIVEIPSYAYLAICRAEKEKQLTISLNLNQEHCKECAEKYFLPKNANTSKVYLDEAIDDWLKRLLLPSLEREIRSEKKKRADDAAIKVFGENMKNLLLTPPIQWLTVLWFDPGFAHGCKLAVVDPTWKFLENATIFPTEPRKDLVTAEKVLVELIQKHKVQLISVGNGTASRESEQFVAETIKKHNLDVKYMITSEAGASIYSASKLAQEEYPELNEMIRWAISIAHRVQDPLAELTKIDPKSIWVWQYQHDVDQKILKEKLDEKVEDTVNAVWVDVNTASYTLLQYIAWLSEKTAKAIVEYRDENGAFESKSQIKKAKWLWPKWYEQAIWFLRIKNWKEPLDETWIHPEQHKKVYEILETEFWIKKKDLKLPLKDIQATESQLQSRTEKYEIWYETLVDIFKELKRPWLDPREEIEAPVFKSDVLDIKDLKIWMRLDWVVRNVTDFGAFVDIGLHNDWLVHKSQMANFYVSNPIDVVSVWQKVSVKVLSIDEEREKVSLTMKDEDNNLSKPERQFKQNKSQKPQNRNENDLSTWLKSNITFSKA